MSTTILCVGRSVRTAQGAFSSAELEAALEAERSSAILTYAGRKYNPGNLSVMTGDGIASADVLLNGRLYASDIAVTDGAVIRVEKADCRGAGLYNVVEVLTKDANGKYLAITKRSGEKGSNANEADYLYWIGN